MSCGRCGYICVKRAGCRTDSDCGFSRVIGCTGAPHPTPGWGQAPALHFSCDPRQSLFGRRWLASPAGAGIDPGSESGTCFPTKVDDFLRRLELLADASNLASPVLTKLPAGWSNSRRRCIGA